MSAPDRYDTRYIPTRESDDPRSRPVQHRDVIDPHRIPITYVDRCPVYDLNGGVASLTLMTFQLTPLEDGTFVNDAIVSARLRFGIEAAREIRDTLNAVIKLIERR